MCRDLGRYHPATGVLLFLRGAQRFQPGPGRTPAQRHPASGRHPAHVGDNPVSDVRVPRRLGIRARLSTASRLAPREARLARPLPGFDPAASLLAGAARTVRCATGPQPDALCDLAADVAAPVFLAFTAWVLTEAARAGIERLHFVSRDGQILYRLARTLRRVWPELPEPHYIHGSRQAWFLPAVGRCTREALDWLFVPGHCRRPEVLLAKLGLTPSDLPDPGPAGAARGAFWSRELPPGREGDFWDLLERPANARCVEAKARQARELAARYFADRTKGLSAFAVVDLGWTLKTQAALETVFRESGLDVPLCGYYFGVSAARSDGLAGRYRAFLVESTRHLDPAETLNPLFRNVNLLEQCFALADHEPAFRNHRDHSGARRFARHPQEEYPASRGCSPCGLEHQGGSSLRRDRPGDRVHGRCGDRGHFPGIRRGSAVFAPAGTEP